jgi:predicted NAD/FAD-binding protein
MRIAVVGSGIAGLSAAWRLSRRHEVVLFEANDYLGGHTHTHEVEQDGRAYRIDTGFIVHNPVHYPRLTALFEELGVASRPTTMGFSVQREDGLEYNATSLDGLFCQRRNLASPRFLGMVADLLRFYRQAPALLHAPGPGPTLGEYLDTHRYGAAFRDDHLVPMASALWSSPAARILEFPAQYLVAFMANHQMLQVAGRPQWRVVEGGSSRYVERLRERWSVDVRLSCPVRAVRRDGHRVQLRHANGIDSFDHLVLACHGDQALALLEDADARERTILGAFEFQPNEVVLHTDARLLPRRRKAWAAWNAYVPDDPAAPCSVSYCMNLLQGIESREPFVVTLNRSDAIDPSRVLRRLQYAHPLYTPASVTARARQNEIQGLRRTWFAGAWWGWGFHEDGIRSGEEVAQALEAHPARLLGVAA